MVIIVRPKRHKLIRIMEQFRKRQDGRTVQVLATTMKVAIFCSFLGGFLLTPGRDSSLRGTEVPNESYECLGWRTTGFCPRGHPLYKLWRRGLYELGWMNQLSCNDKVPLDAIGYCEVLYKGIPQKVFQQSSCSSKELRPEQQTPYFKCSMAQDFVHYKTAALKYEPRVPIPISTAATSTSSQQKGIVMQVYPKALPSVYAIVRLLRKDHGCRLPIELWTDDASIYNHPLFQKIFELGDVRHRTIGEPRFQGFMTKPYSLAYSRFQQVLFLDSDNFPTRDPSYLFESEEFQKEGALFWKDYWNPARDDFFIRQQSVLWELLGITDPEIHQEMEMESGQLLVDRSRNQKALKVLLYFAETYHQWFQPMGLLHGDKDLFRLAWRVTQTPFHYVQQLPGTAGLVNHRFPDQIQDKDGFFRTCGVTMVQHDTAGDPIFLHRNAAKITTRADLINVWDRMETFVGTRPRLQYEMGDYYDSQNQRACCFPKATIHMYFTVSEFSQSTSLAALEDRILSHARDAFDVLDSLGGQGLPQ